MKHFILILCAATALTGCVKTSAQSVTSPTPMSANIETRITPAFEAQLVELMAAYKLNGFSLAVFENYEIVYSKQWGVKTATSDALIDAGTAFSTASLSKPVTALVSLTLAERGLIDLDAPISKYLTRWSLPESPLTEKTPLTMRHLLSHMGGTTQHGFADFYEGDAIPTLIDSVEGRLPRYNNEPIDFIFEPGTDWQYSGGGYTIIQIALEDHFGKPLHQLAKEIIFTPLGMTNTTMVQPNESGFLTNVASVHDAKGDVIRSGLPITPQVSASGMWSTAEDLSKLGITMQKALRGDRDLGLSPEVAQASTDIISLEKSGGHTLAWARAFGFGNVDWARHNGSNTGVGADLFFSMENGSGFAFFANGEKPNRFPIASFVRGEIIRMMGWETPVQTGVALPDKLKAAISGPYKDFLYGSGMETEIVQDGDALYLISPVFQHFINKPRSQMTYLGDNTFRLQDYPNDIRFNVDPQNEVESLTLLREGDTRLTVTMEIGR